MLKLLFLMLNLHACAMWNSQEIGEKIVLQGSSGASFLENLGKYDQVVENVTQLINTCTGACDFTKPYLKNLIDRKTILESLHRAIVDWQTVNHVVMNSLSVAQVNNGMLLRSAAASSSANAQISFNEKENKIFQEKCAAIFQAIEKINKRLNDMPAEAQNRALEILQSRVRPLPLQNVLEFSQSVPTINANNTDNQEMTARNEPTTQITQNIVTGKVVE